MLNREGSVRINSGNEAIARGAVEAGVKVIVGYPGTPSSEVIQSLIPLAKDLDMRVEWTVNEKVAFDIAIGVAIAGSRCLVTMKSAGLNVASDSIMSAAYGDVNGGLVIYVADDPGAHAGMEEQDSRFYAKISLLPMIDVSCPQMAKDAVIEAFEASERYKLPVFLRSTSRVAHTRGMVKYGAIKESVRKGKLQRDIRRFTRASPVWCKEQHHILNEKIERLREYWDESKLNSLSISEINHSCGVIATGVAKNYFLEAMDHNDYPPLTSLTIGTINPLPDKLFRSFLENVDKILVCV